MIAPQAAPQPVPQSVWRSIGRTALIVAAVALAFYILIRIPKTMEVFTIATFIAYGVNPLVRQLSKRIPRGVAILLVYLLFLLLMFVGILVVVPSMIDQVQRLLANSGDYLNSAQTFAQNSQEWVNKKFGGHVLLPQLQKLESQTSSRISDLLQPVISGLGAAAVAVVSGLIIGITALVLSYYFLVNAVDIKAAFLSFFPERAQSKAQLFVREVGRIVGGYVGGQVILCAFCAVFAFFGLELVGSQYAMLLALLTGALYAIPYLGVFGAVAVGALLGLSQSWEIALWSAIVILIITKVADIFLVPKVMGESVGVSPMGIIFAIFAGGELFGLWGLVLAIPAAALFKAVWIVWLFPWLTGRHVATDV